MTKFLKAVGEVLLETLKKPFSKKQKLSWPSLIPYAIIFLLLFLLLNLLFIVSAIVFIVFLIWLIIITFNPDPHSYFPKWMLRIFALAFIFMLFSLVLSIFVPNTDLGRFVITDTFIHVDQELDTNTNLYVSIINALDFKTTEQTFSVTEDKTISFDVEYLENVTETLSFPVVISGKFLEPIGVSDPKLVECPDISCKLSIAVLNLKNNFDVDVDVSYNILIYENQVDGPTSLADTESENYGVVRIPASSSKDLRTHVVYSPKDLPYFAKIDPDSVSFKFVPNDNIKIMDETKTREVTRTKTEQRIETLTYDKTVNVINSFWGRFLVRLGTLR
ncbi:hypothetical protein HN592_03745 [Candidatus Woesearchaeota archaeon]|jgi:hypothetical protein|nr:hypothetical protein [Candidatus Woesearchaeota archaeon]MBT4368326.1 hypothetical protein [Candidatus Woesearchaeota archaeon]MBT4712815.1 hypothetical protein [Candidatus Woesearchaeota archaeon]MBT6639727.1 hypothetical protein [Candidatus Woesearchaeota archaeon]MBT7133899.1 hypothetical protein [Candidatus Woesearchaeota archaeon]